MMRTFAPFFRDGRCLKSAALMATRPPYCCSATATSTVVEGARESSTSRGSRVGDKGVFVRGLVEDFETTARYGDHSFSPTCWNT